MIRAERGAACNNRLTGEMEPLLDRSSGVVAPTLGTGARYYLALVLLVFLNVADAVLVVLLFDVWGERYSLFINQGTAFVYIVWSACALLLNRQRCFTGGARALTLIAIGLMNGSGNFFMAISQPHTPGLSQTLLNLLGVPLVLSLSWLFLGRRPSLTAGLGAALIVGGTASSSLRDLLLQPSGNISNADSGAEVVTAVVADGSPGSPIVVYGWAIALFAVAQLFLAGEKVYEEHTFRDSQHAVHPMQMFFWTLVTQFSLGWALYPLQTLKALGGVDLDQLPQLLANGTACAVGYRLSPDGGGGCGVQHTALFWTYCAVDFWCYFFGLWVIQRGGATLMVLASAIALPLQQLVLCTPALVGKWSEHFFVGDAIALVLTLVGFGVYQGLAPEGIAARRGKPPSSRIQLGGAQIHSSLRETGAAQDCSEHRAVCSTDADSIQPAVD